MPATKKPRRKTVYLPPGIYPMTLLSMLYPADRYKLYVTKDGKPPKRNKKKRKLKCVQKRLSRGSRR